MYIKCIYMHDAKNSALFINVFGPRWNVKYKLHNLLVIKTAVLQFLFLSFRIIT